METFGVVWLTGAVRFEGLEPTLSLGFCGKAGSVAFVSLDAGVNAMRPAIVDEVEVRDGVCSDGEWCLSFECPYNETTYESFREADADLREALETERDFERFRERVEAAEERLAEEGLAPDRFESGLMQRFREPVVTIGTA